jgi:subtilase family serine protease
VSRRLLVGLVCLITVSVGTPVAIAQLHLSGGPSGAAGRVTLPDPIPSWVVDSTDEGPAPATLVIRFRLYLSGRAPKAELRFATAVSRPGSKLFRHYLSPRQFELSFGPSTAQVSLVRRWASAHGLKVTGSNDHYVSLRGSAPAVGKALDTTIDGFGGTATHPDGYAPVRSISVPGSIASDVLTAVGLDDESLSAAVDRVGMAAPDGQRGTRSSGSFPCSSWWGQRRAAIPTAYGRTGAPTADCGYAPSQLRSAYGIGRYTGRGATIAIVLDGHLATMLSDADRFFATHHVRGFAKDQFRQNFGPGFAASCGNFADLPEEPLDVETAHIIAPDATVIYVAVNCSTSTSQQHINFLDAETRIVDQHLADVETDSFSTLESLYTPAMVAAWSKIFEQGAAEGVGFNFDSGDGGDDRNNDPSVPAAITFPASDPWATAVGGTALEIGRTGRVVGELGWGDTIARENGARTAYLQKPPGLFGEGSTGGRSALFAQPAYQRGVVPRLLATAGGAEPAARETPDIAADADPLTGWLIAYTQSGRYQEIVEGGTSGASPITAALEADAKQASGQAIGFANPTLYALAGGAAIRDIVAPEQPAFALAPASQCYNGAAGRGPCLVTLGLDSSLHEARGYDDVTGLGAATSKFVALAAKG